VTAPVAPPPAPAIPPADRAPVPPGAGSAGAPRRDAAGRLQRAAAPRAERAARRRRRRARVWTLATGLATLAALAPLASLLAFLVARGAGALATLPSLAPALAGSALLLGIAGGAGVPVGLAAGLYLHERRGTRGAGLVRYLCDVLVGVPSVVLGVAAWLLVVRPSGHFSAWAGGLALAAAVVPLVARAADDVLALVPPALGEAALALGYGRWRATLTVVLRAAAPGVLTGVLAAVARVAGETAPLLFTALGNQYWSLRPGGPVAALPLQIFADAGSADPAVRARAYAAALVLVSAVAVFGAAARAAARRIAAPAERRRAPRGGGLA
jgi:phosphate transport system permease protein